MAPGAAGCCGRSMPPAEKELGKRLAKIPTLQSVA
jgi:hypothetical protein